HDKTRLHLFHERLLQKKPSTKELSRQHAVDHTVACARPKSADAVIMCRMWPTCSMHGQHSLDGSARIGPCPPYSTRSMRRRTSWNSRKASGKMSRSLLRHLSYCR